MPYFAVQYKGEKLTTIVQGENRADAVLQVDANEYGQESQDIQIRENHDESINSYCEVLLAEYDVTELYRAMVIEYLEWHLDGDKNISFML